MKIKQNKKQLLVLGMLLVGVLVLSGCARAGGMEPITADSTGIWDRLLYTLSQIIIWLSGVFGNSYGMGIIVFTILARLLLTPLYSLQMKNTEKMQKMQPELRALQEKYASRDAETQQKLQEETAKLQEKYDTNQFAGCLPLLIQLPILTALYQAISRTEALTNGHFLWMELGKPDPYFILPIIAAVSIWYSTHLSQVASGIKSGSMTAMQYVMPVFIFFVMMNLPSALALYMATANVFTIGQTLLINNPYQKQRVRQEEEAKEKDLERRLEKARRNPRGKKRK